MCFLIIRAVFLPQMVLDIYFLRYVFIRKSLS